ncbi:hypothetical protein BDV96DRAFT_569342 [Lophiotrema nucula]|uniref:Pal1 cell morphology protein-domain-containing protein n=1 Tax=Lophiotrema nucula TaxID=690887 RepID=A0A6A5ZFA0_9PLEO|nr:hypothetical protein BDV96DRAFT_569342 [Lophiotrema nucula]
MDRAHHALIDPLVESTPAEETGLNSHFRSTFAPRQKQNLPSPPASAGLKESPSVSIRHHHTGSSSGTNPFRAQHTGSSVETNPYRRSRGSSVSKANTLVDHGAITPRSPRRHEYPSPPNSASPRRENFHSYRNDAFGSLNEGRPRRSSNPPASNLSSKRDGGLQRGGSLRERYPGDMSHRPLDAIKKDTKTAHRAHHLRKKNFTGADTIDRLDLSMGVSYHHEGPYDAANLSRNLDYKHSPVAAVRRSNQEALRATPKENIVDALSKHRPLEGVADLPPGMADRFGRILTYEEGADLMREPGGDYRRWPGVDYLPGDLKGKGEPSYSIEKALKDHKSYGEDGIELQPRRRNQSLSAADAPESVPLASGSGLGRSNTTGKNVGNSLKKRFGSMRRRKDRTSETVEA